MDLRSESRSARIVGTFVLLVWAAFVVHAAWYVANYGSPVATRDDMELLPALLPGATPRAILTHLWLPLNEHRILLPQFLHFLAVGGTHDFRAGGHVQVGLHAIAALACILTARRLRGSTRLEDALFPMLLLNWGNGENLLLGTQICIALAILLSTIAACALVWTPGPPSGRRIAVVGACAVLLPLSSGFGLCPAPAFAAWLAAAGVGAVRTRRRGAALGAFAATAACVVCIALCLRGIHHLAPPPEGRRVDIGAAIVLQVLAMGFGGAATFHPRSALFAAIACTTCLAAWIVRGARAPVADRWRAFGLAVVFGAAFLLALSIAWSRQTEWPEAGWAARYALATSPFVIATVFGAVLFGGRAGRVFVGVLAIVSLVAMPAELARGRAFAEEHALIVEPFVAGVEAALTVEELARINAGPLYPTERALRDRIEMLRRLRFPPYDERREGEQRPSVEIGVPFALLRSARPPIARRIGGVEVTTALAPAVFAVELPESASRAEFFVAIPRFAYSSDRAQDEHTLGVRYRVVQTFADRPERELATRTLLPDRSQADRGLQLVSVALEAGGGRLELRVESVSNERAGTDWLGVSRMGTR